MIRTSDHEASSAKPIRGCVSLLAAPRDPEARAARAATRLAPHFGRILVATDGTPSSAFVLPWARALAHAHHARVWSLHVTPPLGPDGKRAPVARGQGPHPTANEIVARAQVDLEGVHAESVLGYGDPSHEIVTLARATRAELVILGGQPKANGRRAGLGHVARAVKDQSTASVLVARTAPKPSEMLVAYDRGPTSQRALEIGKELATSWGSRLTVLEVVARAPRAATPARREPRWDLPGAPGQITYARQVDDDARERIASVAEEIRASLILMGSRRPGRPKSFVVGSVSNYILATASASVLTVKEA